MKIKELLRENNPGQSNPNTRAIIQNWVDNTWIDDEGISGDSVHGFQIDSMGNAEVKLETFEIVNEMLNSDGTFPFKLTRANVMKVRATNLSSFKNFPEIIEKWSFRPIVLDMLAPNFPHLTSLEGFPKYCRGHVRLSRAKNLSFANVHKHILAADVISVNEYYVGPMLGFLKIENLSEIRYLFADKGNFHEAAEIINKYIPKGNLLECQEELMDNGLKEYAKF